MAAPTSPYALASDVALFQTNFLNKATTFDTTTRLPKTTIDAYITMVSSQIDIRLSQAGYKLPLAVISGETWLTFQTDYLTLLVCLGVGAFIGLGTKPAPAMGVGQTGAPSNLFKTTFDEELKKIYDMETRSSTARFRADFYLGTPAELAVSEPVRPKSDWLEGYIDPTKYQSLDQYTNLMYDINNEIANAGYDWDYGYDLLNMGYGS